MPSDVVRAIERISRAPDVQLIAVMPDVHLARDVCVGTVVATESLVYPAAVGSDIGCGVAAIAFHEDADAARDEGAARAMLEQLAVAVPIHRHREAGLPPELQERPMS